MPTYRVLRGTHRRTDGSRAERGDTVELTESQRDDFPAEKFERVGADEDDDADAEAGEDAAPTPAELAEETNPDVAPTPDETAEVEASGDVPEDYTLLTKMAKHYEGDEVHGAMGGDELQEFFGDLSDTEIAHLKEEARNELEDEE